MALTVNLGVTHQTIDGFGCSSAYRAMGSQTMTDLFDPVDGIGLNLLRVLIRDNGQPWAGFDDAQAATAYGARIFGVPLSPPAAYTTNGTTVGGHLRADSYGAFGDYLAAWVTLMRANGCTVEAISPQNEPNLVTTYQNCQYTSFEMRDFVAVLGPKLAALSPTVGVMAAESCEWNSAVSGSVNPYDLVLTDPTSSPYVTIAAAHGYWVQQSPALYGNWPAAVTAGKRIWQTEVSDPGNESEGFPEPTPDMGSGVQYAYSIHYMLERGVNAWMYWMGKMEAWRAYGEGESPFWGNEALIDTYPAPLKTKRYYVLGQWSKFVRPGATRCDVSGTSSADVTAFRNTGGGVVVVAVNRTAAPVTLDFDVIGGTPPVFGVWLTDGTHDLESTADAVPTGSSYSYQLPTMSVTTFAPTRLTASSAPVVLGTVTLSGSRPSDSTVTVTRRA